MSEVPLYEACKCNMGANWNGRTFQEKRKPKIFVVAALWRSLFLKTTPNQEIANIKGRYDPEAVPRGCLSAELITS